MPIPDSLAERIALFRDSANAYQADHELFRVASWLQVMLGQRLEPASHHPLVGQMPPDQLKAAMDGMSDAVAQATRQLPAHQDFLDRYCPQGA
jgi:tryptophan halogenase